MKELVPADDGLLARRAGEYAREKLDFLEAFMPPALSIAGGMPDRTYLDLFAGPGRNRTDRGLEFAGSPIIGLSAAANAKHRRGFSRAHLVNYKRQVAEQLAARVARLQDAGASRVHASAVHQHVGDANVLLPQIMDSLPRKGYVLAFADITGLKHWPWSSVERLRSGGHTAVDLYVLFPMELTIDRLLGVDRARAEVYGRHFDAFFGTDEWRAHYDERISSAQGGAFRTALIELYRRRLESIWKHAIVACAPGVSEDRAYYRMFFATSNEAALKAATWAKRSPPRGQTLLDLA